MKYNQEFNISLVGYPNCGKSTFFNLLTDNYVKIGNFEGVTVEKKSSQISLNLPEKNWKFNLWDLPGVKSYPEKSIDGVIAWQEIAKSDAIFFLLDATQLRNQLDILFFLKQLNKPMLVFFNMMDIIEKEKTTINIAEIEKKLGIKIFPTNANRSNSKNNILTTIQSFIYAHIDEIKQKKTNNKTAKILHDNSSAQYKENKKLIKEVISENYFFDKDRLIDHKYDKYLLHPLWGWLIFLGILFVFFQSVFIFSAYPTELIGNLLGYVADKTLSLNMPEFLKDFLEHVFFSGTGIIIELLPQIFFIYLAIYLLEATGYMTRAAILIDKFMRFIGLDGSAIIPLLSGFACAIPAILTTRHIENHKQRLISMFLIPVIPCAARLPVYVLIVSAVIPEGYFGLINIQGFVIFLLYLTGLLISFLVAIIISNFIEKTKDERTYFNLPRIQMININHLCNYILRHMISFIKRLYTVILISVFILWLFINYPLNAPDIASSLGGQVGKFFHSFLQYIGFNLEMSIALIPGLAAREVAVSALGTIYSVQGGGEEMLRTIISNQWTLPMSLSFLAWYVVAPQCLSTIATLYKEVNSLKKISLLVIFLFGLAYLFSFIVYNSSKIMLSFFG